MPAIIRFLGYNPLPAAQGMGERLVRQHDDGAFAERGSETARSGPEQAGTMGAGRAGASGRPAGTGRAISR